MGINILSKGLSTDNPIMNQPESTYLYALNAIIESEQGNVGLISNENSNIECAKIKNNYTIIGHCYIGDNQTCIFSVSNDNQMSEIGILDSHCDYKEVVNTSVLNFNINYQIDAIYRVKNGCDKIVYWTDNLNYPRQFNFNKQSQYQDSDSNWIAEKFNIQKLSKSIPQYNKINVLDSGGNLYSGSYQIALQYVDDNGNPTEWMNISNKIIIYNDSMLSNFDTIEGSIHLEKIKELNFPKTNKAIQISLKNLDSTFKYIRYAIIGFFDGVANISKIFVTDKISLNNGANFIFTGDNYISEIQEGDLVQFNNVIATAKNITQLDNKLILSNLTSPNIEWYKLQQFASQIQADCVVKSISMDSLSIVGTNLDNEDNPKHPLQYFNGTGYLPGEMYSFGIVYVLENGQTSPVFHIPGKNQKDKDIVYGKTDNLYPMSIDNQIDILYENNSLCLNNDYWGLDNKQRQLLNQKVRHHKFPTRKEIKVPHIEQDYGVSQNISLKISYQIIGEFYRDVYYRMNEEGQAIDEDGEVILDKEGSPITNSLKQLYPQMSLRAIYKNNDGNITTFEETVTVIKNDEVHYDGDEETETASINYKFELPEQFDKWTDDSTVTFEVKYDGSEWISLEEHQNSDDIKQHWKSFDIKGPNIEDYATNKSSYKTNILGIQFNNIIKPNDTVLGQKIVGYYIVQQERTLTNKSILDTGVILPALKYEKYIGCGLVAPEGNLAKENIYKNAVGLLHYSHLFDNYNLGAEITIEYEGDYVITKRSNTVNIYNDVMEGSSYEQLKEDENLVFNTWDDFEFTSDGFSAAIYFRNNEVKFEFSLDTNNNFNIQSKDIKQFTLLNPFDTCNIDDDQDPIFYNMMLDQSITCIEFTKGVFNYNFYNTQGQLKLPYIILKRNISNQYSDFRTASYYKFQNNYVLFDSDKPTYINVFNGNSFISAIQFNSTLYYDVKAPVPATKPRGFWESTWGYIIGGIAAVAGIALLAFTGGASTALIYVGTGLITAGAGVSLLTGLKQVQYNNLMEAIKTHYKKGLQKTIIDDWVYDCFNAKYWIQHYNTIEIAKIYIDSLWMWLNNQGSDYIKHRSENTNHVLALIKEFFNNKKTNIISFEHQSEPIVDFADDTLIYLNDSLNCLWFESDYNAFMRTNMLNGLPAYLPANTVFEPFIFIQPKNNDNSVTLLRINGSNDASWETYKDNRPPQVDFQIQSKNDIESNSTIEAFINKKMFSIKDDKKEINAVPIPEFYAINPDYLQQKLYQKYYMIPSTYSFCSQCAEKFPTRWTWSESSYDEEINDNYSIFKPNNYKDITAATGEIMNMFVQNSNLYFHTKEALYLQPRAYQERVTDQIITYIGSGEYGNLPERKLVDDVTGLSAGLSNKWYSLQNKFGYFFVCESENIVYIFNQKLESISNTGLRKWFQNNIQFNNNSTNEITVNKGFVFGYDPKYQRILLTKQDLNIKILVNDSDLIENGYIFKDYEIESSKLIDDGYTFTQFMFLNNKYVAEFKKDITTTEIEYTSELRFPNADYLLFYYDFSESDGKDLDNWTTLYIDDEKIGSVGYHTETQTESGIIRSNYYLLDDKKNKILEHSTDNQNKGLESFYIDLKQIKKSFPNANDIKFNAKANWYKRNPVPDNPMMYLKLQVYQGGTIKLIDTEHKFINEGGTLLTSENGYKLNPVFIYSNDDGKNTDLYTNIGDYEFDLNTGQLLFNGNKIDTLLNDEIRVPIEVEKTKSVYQYIEGLDINSIAIQNQSNAISNSWTLSYSLLNQTWTSFHSYLPYGYITMPNQLYSYKYNDSKFYLHNQDYHYQKFYNKQHPFIIEYVDVTTTTNLTDYVTFKTTCLKYDIDTDTLLETKLITFNKAIMYNSRQCSGLLELRFKDSDNYLQEQISDNDYTLIDKTEEDYNINDFRDIRIDYDKPIFNSKIDYTLDDFQDKILNQTTLDKNKNWIELEPFRDKYLIIRLIFDNFDNKLNQSGLYKLVVNYIVNQNQNISIR